MIHTGELKAQVLIDIAHRLKRIVDVEQANGRSVGILGVKNERLAKHGFGHISNAAKCKQARKSPAKEQTEYHQTNKIDDPKRWCRGVKQTVEHDVRETALCIAGRADCCDAAARRDTG